jgi:spermidine synthase
VLAAAFCSGCATLVYELLWVRTLSLTVGATFPAITVVLSGIMAGLGLGSVIGGRLADRVRDPLRIYALVEVAVAITAASFPFLALRVTSLDIPTLGPFSGRAWIAGLTMLPVTTLIGTTFPLLSSSLHGGDDGDHVPRLYFANTVGAAIGAVLGGLWLPYAIGVVPALITAASLNLLAAGLGRLSRTPERAPAPTTTTAAVDVPALLLGLGFGSGVLLTLAQLFWTRSILQIDREQLPFPEAGEVMACVLATLLGGNAIGGLVASRLRGGIREVARPLAWIWIVGAVLCAAAFEWFGVRYWGLGTLLEGTAWALPARLAPVLLASAVLGTTFPLLARLYSGALEGHGGRMGRIWAWNTAGAVLGSVFGGWLLMPAIGTDRGLALCAGIALLLAAGVAKVGGTAREWIGLGVGVAAIAAAVVLVPLGPGQDWIRKHGEGTVLASWEGWEATTIVTEIEQSQPQIYSNGRGMTSMTRYLSGGRYMGLAMRGARDVLVVGFGTGGLTKGLLETLQPDHLTIVEIDGAQFRAAKWFQTDTVLSDPRVTVVVDDALHYLATTTRTFDLIIIDGWGPSATPALYTADFHQRALARLTATGKTWAKLGPITEASRKPLQDAFRCVYPYAWTNPDDSFLVGSPSPVRVEGSPAPPAGPDCDPLTNLRPRHIRAKSEEVQANGAKEPAADGPTHPPPDQIPTTSGGPDPNKLPIAPDGSVIPTGKGS